jgi:N-acetylmuramoyl-L-alanine amidase
MGLRLHVATVLSIVLSALVWLFALPPAWAEGAVAPAKRPGVPVCDRAAFRVVVDVGHTLEVPGAKSARGVSEYEFNLRLGKLIEQNLLEAGFGKTVLLVTEGPARKSLTERVAKANKSSADLFLSIHHDSVPNRFLEKWEFEGTERGFSDRFKGHSIFVSVDNADPKGSLQFAQLLGRQLKTREMQYTPHYTNKIMGSRQRLLVDAEAGVYRYDQLIVLKSTQMPAVLLEAGSIINRDEELLLGTPEHQGLISAAVTEAVESYCALRRPRNSLPQAASRQGAVFKRPAQPAAAASAPTPH